MGVSHFFLEWLGFRRFLNLLIKKRKENINRQKYTLLKENGAWNVYKFKKESVKFNIFSVSMSMLYGVANLWRIIHTKQTPTPINPPGPHPATRVYLSSFIDLALFSSLKLINCHVTLCLTRASLGRFTRYLWRFLSPCKRLIMLGKENFAKPPLPAMQKAKTPILWKYCKKFLSENGLRGFLFRNKVMHVSGICILTAGVSLLKD